MTAIRLPVVDPAAALAPHLDDVRAAVERVIASGWFILGEEVARFEEEFAAVCGAAFGIGVASGTDAVALALEGCGVGAGDGVLTVSHTAVATVAAIESTGATPILVDIDGGSFTMSAAALETRLDELAKQGSGVRPRAIVAVHLYGNPAPMGDIARIAHVHGLDVVEDVAQAHGASLDGQAAGSLGRAAAFSFYPTKNLGAIGDAGIVVTSDEDVRDRVRRLRQYGWEERYVSAVPGRNSRLDEVQAAVLRVLLPHLEGANAHRRAVANRYDQGLAGGAGGDPRTRRAGSGARVPPVRRPDTRARPAARAPGRAWNRDGGALPGARPPPACVPAPRRRRRPPGDRPGVWGDPQPAHGCAREHGGGRHRRGGGARLRPLGGAVTRAFCTYFDVNYLSRGLALYESLCATTAGDFTLDVLCLDDEAERRLRNRALSGVRLTRLADLEGADPELLATKGTRSRIEYIFTAGPAFMRHLFDRDPALDLLTYLDSDLYFFSSPEPLFEEADDAGAATVIVGHRFPDRLRHLEETGRYNVAWVSFRRDPDGLACLDYWRSACIDWCHDRVEGDRYADQKYLDQFPRRFARVHELQHPGADVAPWNIDDPPLRWADGSFLVNDRPLVFFHFQGFKFQRFRAIGPSMVDPNLAAYGARADKAARRLYRTYLAALRRTAAGVAAASPRRADDIPWYRRCLRQARAVVRGDIFLART